MQTPSEEIDPRFGKKFRELRESRGMGLRELARNIDISPGFLSQIERGHRPGLTGTTLRKALLVLQPETADEAKELIDLNMETLARSMLRKSRVPQSNFLFQINYHLFHEFFPDGNIPPPRNLHDEWEQEAIMSEGLSLGISLPSLNGDEWNVLIGLLEKRIREKFVSRTLPQDFSLKKEILKEMLGELMDLLCDDDITILHDTTRNAGHIKAKCSPDILRTIGLDGQ